MSDEPAYSPGLAGVPCARSAVCYLDGTIGKLQYRGYPIEKLAEVCTFEEIVHLLLFGELPSRAALEGFSRELASLRAVPESVMSLVASLPREGHPMAALSTALDGMGMVFSGDHVGDVAYRRTTALRLVACFPTLIAAFERVRHGKKPIAPREDLGHAASFLYMLSGEAPDDILTKTLDVGLVLHAEHQMNASTFAARVVGSTLATPWATMAAAVSALSGPLHGGANERVLALLESIPSSSPEDVRAWAAARLAAKDKVMGFGHREYKVKDPRASILQKLAADLFAAKGKTPLYDIAVELERQMAELVGEKGIYPNVDFYSGMVYAKMGISTDLFTPIFAIARIAGWTAHLLEQLEDNRIFRPNQIWTGEMDRAVPAIDER
jgi:citrate synthase